jgi:hypothetical protein
LAGSVRQNRLAVPPDFFPEIHTPDDVKTLPAASLKKTRFPFADAA